MGEFENIDYEVASKYVAANCSRQEIKEAKLDRIIPHRRKKKGAKPGVTTRELNEGLKIRGARKGKKDNATQEGAQKRKDQRKEEKQEQKECARTESKWQHVDVEGLNKEDKKRLIPKVIEIAIREIHKN